MSGFFNHPPNWKKHWQGMPAFDQKDLSPFQSITVHFRNPEDRIAFTELLERKLTVTSKTPSIWYPEEGIERSVRHRRYKSEEPLNPRYPIYIISKGRWESRQTSKALDRMNVPYHIVVEPQEYDDYASVIDPDKILTLPFSNLGQGSIPARNWVWEHSIEAGAARHWILDDNIRCFYRLVNNTTPQVMCGNIFRAAEDLCDRYENVALSGFQYYMFVTRKSVLPAFYLNTRIYSCILIKNDLTHRWRGRYNEDTDLSIRILKDGWCTILINAFLAHKQWTMTMKGGNTDELYQGDGRHDMAKSLEEQHPDIVKVTRKWDRWQHSVDYSSFRRNKLIPKGEMDCLKEVDEYKMYLETDDEYDAIDEVGKILLIGQGPGRNGDLSKPLEGKIGERLAKLSGLSVVEYLKQTERTNLLNEWFGKNGKGDVWPADDAIDSAGAMVPLLTGRKVIMVGRNVANAFGLKNLNWLEWRWEEDLRADVCVIPHPSGIVLWWNEKENKKKAAKFLRSIFGGEL